MHITSYKSILAYEQFTYMYVMYVHTVQRHASTDILMYECINATLKPETRHLNIQDYKKFGKAVQGLCRKASLSPENLNGKI